MKTRHLILGITCWAGLILAAWTALRTELATQASSVTDLSADVVRWATDRRQSITAHCVHPVGAAIGDPVFLPTPDGSYRQVGLVVNINGTLHRHPLLTEQVELLIYDNAIQSFSDGYQLEYHTTPKTLDWVLKTMISPARQAEIAQVLSEEWQVQQQNLKTNLRPVLQSGFRRAMKAVEAELPGILAAHREDFQALGKKYETEILKAEIVPLIREEILPIIEEEAVPVLKDVGQAMWKRVSLWSFAWRFVYDRSPLPKRDAVKTEFQRFVDQEAIPELRSRTDQFISLTDTIIKRCLKNPRVHEVIQRNLRRIAEDPELHQVVWSVVRQAVLENQTLRSELEAHLRDQETKAAVQMAGDRLEPVVRRIGDMIFGSREKGVTAEFSRVLRSQILIKDRRWFIMLPSQSTSEDSGEVRVVYAREPMTYPLGFDGEAQSPLTIME